MKIIILIKSPILIWLINRVDSFDLIGCIVSFLGAWVLIYIYENKWNNMNNDIRFKEKLGKLVYILNDLKKEMDELKEGKDTHNALNENLVQLQLNLDEIRTAIPKKTLKNKLSLDVYESLAKLDKDKYKNNDPKTLLAPILNTDKYIQKIIKENIK